MTMGIHDNHRKRLREEFIKNGEDSFSDHKLLELLLFNSIPRIDTNPLAHRLTANFGSLSDLFNADYEELLEVYGVGENTAVLIKLVAAIHKRCEMNEHTNAVRFETVDKVGRFLTALFSGHQKELIYLLLFNSRLEIIEVVKIGEGHICSVLTSARAVIESALNNKHASGIVLAHNHPSGLALPSGDDIELTGQLEFLCNQLGVKLMEHMVVSGNDFYPIMRHKKQLK